ncbi:YggS family pyridoxal phosphate-dependent enzyme [Sulfuriferula nivalis]|uniref:Pyridoxal phosphate homeostasis protein n=1 Tax=Sulfuriferula nivalis TaxID=2675298 RepID=A0A809SIH2_9PROT|nr:YggS family pyridoxal phosphate-dependent enzyme [Sulfuriferula nivalis]BBP01880.1 YggS family pyridoxal phosphate enzyme [Sulfuriferula nivalis]
MDIVKSTLQAVQERIAQAAQNAERDVNEITLLAVSKLQPVASVRALAEQGQHAFGESYVQESVAKIQALRDLALDWHFIGPIQRNKTAQIAAHFSWVHSVDRLLIAQRLSNERANHAAPLNICLQVNVSGEVSKSGVSMAEVPALARAVQNLPNLHLRGLMAIPRAEVDENKQRAQFALVRTRFEELNNMGLQLDTLSMGMSADLEAAIAEGATIVRVGTALFGKREG